MGNSINSLFFLVNTFLGFDTLMVESCFLEFLMNCLDTDRKFKRMTSYFCLFFWILLHLGKDGKLLETGKFPWSSTLGFQFLFLLQDVDDGTKVHVILFL